MENYELLTKIGSGACGAVYLVRSHTNGRQYALKKVQLDEQKRTRTRAALLREAGILAKLKHPHIVVYHDSFFDTNTDDLHYIHIVQDYCDGGTLDDKIIEMRKKQKYFEESSIMEWFIQIAMAVQYIHSNKILHRDLKSQNVFMTKSDGVKLGDFGIAKALDNTLDAAVTCVGTPCNLSPEMCQDIPYSSKADIWALGCLLFELCALKSAFDAKNLISLFYKITQGEYEPLPSHYSTDITQLIADILIKDPEKRPSASAILNMATVRNYLELFIQDREYLLKQKIITLKAKMSGDSGASSPVHHRSRASKPTDLSSTVRRSTPVMHAHQLKPLPDLRKSLPPQVANSFGKDIKDTENVERDTRLSRANKDISPDEVRGRTSTNYSDDFDSSSGTSDGAQASEEEIPEEISGDSVDSPDGDVFELPPTADSHTSPTTEPTATEYNNTYDDDFEEDSEAEELDEIISKAREVQSLQPLDEYFVDENHTPQNPTQSIRQYLDKLGDMPEGYPIQQ